MASLPVIGSMARRHVLLVDDFEDALEVWTMFFEASGYTVTTAGTAASALERAASPSLDAVVLDLQLPDASGLDVGRRLRATRDGLALVALTGRARPRCDDRACSGLRRGLDQAVRADRPAPRDRANHSDGAVRSERTVTASHDDSDARRSSPTDPATTTRLHRHSRMGLPPRFAARTSSLPRHGSEETKRAAAVPVTAVFPTASLLDHIPGLIEHIADDLHSGATRVARG